LIVSFLVWLCALPPVGVDVTAIVTGRLPSYQPGEAGESTAAV
jgi:hypothetical protein